jgi:polyisoprenoid-binding protein YceI
MTLHIGLDDFSDHHSLSQTLQETSMKHFFSTIFVLLLSVSAANAATYTLDKDHTRVIYFVSHLGFSNFMGHFNDISGTVDFNPSKAEASKVDVTINAKSVSMDTKVLDEHLQGKDYFNTDQFPTIVFKSTGITKTGTDTGKMTGNVTLLGVTKPMTLDVKLNKKGFNEFAKAAAVGFSATGTIKRSDFGMKTLVPLVSDDVTLRIEVEAHAASASVEK